MQIVPAVIGEIMNDPDPDKSGKAMKALLTMKKIDMATLLQAAGKRDAA